ncbi:hypothetical protein KP509_1Z279600 [Ceratopteris richardii]|nr:hypothetical protein KP509_1Z279600 [Ceratopteris richardii]
MVSALLVICLQVILVTKFELTYCQRYLIISYDFFEEDKACNFTICEGLLYN